MQAEHGARHVNHANVRDVQSIIMDCAKYACAALGGASALLSTASGTGGPGRSHLRLI